MSERSIWEIIPILERWRTTVVLCLSFLRSSKRFFSGQVVGRQIKKGPIRPERRKTKKTRPAERVVKPLPLITLSLEEGPNNTLHAQRDPARDSSGVMTRHCSLLDCRKYVNGSTMSLPISSVAESSELEDEDCKQAKTLMGSSSDPRHSKPVFPDVLHTPTTIDCDKNRPRDVAEERGGPQSLRTPVTPGRTYSDKVITSMGSWPRSTIISWYYDKMSRLLKLQRYKKKAKRAKIS